ncbi:MAG: polysaccharide pyruvyl transferase family protein [Bacteroidales bacterium]|nr:polysaccharide pyruvyl transferase family protein [Bacteroidales bacterium]
MGYWHYVKGCAFDGKTSVCPPPLAVRGPLTRKILLDDGFECPEVYGDPALLLPRIYKPKPQKKRYRIGFIPHFHDLNSCLLSRLVDSMPEDCCVINLKKYKSFESVLDLINSCQYVVSSSLHGLIISDAYGIPNLWVKFRSDPEQDAHKYQDYFLSVGRVADVYKVTEETTVGDLVDYIETGYSPINIDLEPLIKAFPYKITFNDSSFHTDTFQHHSVDKG